MLRKTKGFIFFGLTFFWGDGGARGAISFKDCKYDLLADAVRKYTAEFSAAHNPYALSEDEIKALDALSSTLADVNQYHSSQVQSVYSSCSCVLLIFFLFWTFLVSTS